MTLEPPVRTLEWRDDRLWILDQELLPGEERWLRIDTVDEMVAAIRRLAIRGAPALGCAAAAGCVIAVREATAAAGGLLDEARWRQALEDGGARITAARPTAVNLAHGVQAMQLAAAGMPVKVFVVDAWNTRMKHAALAYQWEDRDLCEAIAEHAQELLPEPATVLTHCNAGALATGGLGTALGPLHLAASRGRTLKVYADETRPLRQGARLTAWEMSKSGIPCSVLCDGAAASLLASGAVDLVIVGSDRIAANGDVANKIGTYGLALAARAHDVPFYVAAPSTTYDLACPDGASIPIEQRDPAEVLLDARIDGVDAWNPAFDVTPAALVSAWITERGVHRSVEALRAAMATPAAG